MRLTTPCLTAGIAMAAMAFVGTSLAFGQADEIVLCKELVKLCPNGKLWPSGTELLLLAPGTGASEPATLGTLDFKCEDSTGTGVSTAGIGSPLGIEIKTLAFGKLPTPTLGEGCSGGCSQVHVTLPIAGQLEVAGEDEYYLKVSFLNLDLCFGTACGFLGENIKVPIKHTGKHPNHSGENLALVNFNEVTLPLHKGSKVLCGPETKWDADYVIYLAHGGGESGLAWPSLDRKV